MGILMYLKYVSFFHLPRILIMESCLPRSAAVVAAPIRKLWPAYFVGSIPGDHKAFLMWEIYLCFVKGVLSLNWNIGPGEFPRIAKNAVTAATGQRSSPVFPTKMCTPLNSRSVLDVLRKILSTEGLQWLSIAMSPRFRCFWAHYWSHLA